MPKVYIIKPISVNLTADSKDTVHLVPGLQDVSQELAEHWFVQAHCQDLSELTDDTAANEVIAQMEAQLASAQTELEEAQGKVTTLQQQVTEKDSRIAQLEAQLASAQAPADAATDKADPKAPAKTK